MKTLAVVLLSALLALGVTSVFAQTGSAPSTPSSPPAAGGGQADSPGRPGVSAPGSSTSPATPPGGSDGGQRARAKFSSSA